MGIIERLLNTMIQPCMQALTGLNGYQFTEALHRPLLRTSNCHPPMLLSCFVGSSLQLQEVLLTVNDDQ